LKTKINERCISIEKRKKKGEREREKEKEKQFLSFVKINLPYKIPGRIICGKI